MLNRFYDVIAYQTNSKNQQRVQTFKVSINFVATWDDFYLRKRKQSD